MESQHPIEAEGEVHLARQAIIAANVGRNVEEGLFVEGAIGIFVPTVLVSIQYIESFDRTSADGASDVGPCFLLPPTAVGENTSAAHAYITARFQYVPAVGRSAWHGGYEAFKARTQVFP